MTPVSQLLLHLELLVVFLSNLYKNHSFRPLGHFKSMGYFFKQLKKKIDHKKSRDFEVDTWPSPLDWPDKTIALRIRKPFNPVWPQKTLLRKSGSNSPLLIGGSLLILRVSKILDRHPCIHPSIRWFDRYQRCDVCLWSSIQGAFPAETVLRKFQQIPWNNYTS